MSTPQDSGNASEKAAELWPSGLREGYAELGDVRLHYVEAGEGPLIVLLHGFPEFWYAWRQQIEPLVAAGFRVVAPDTRGYNLSSKPEGVASYDISLLADDARRELLATGEKVRKREINTYSQLTSQEEHIIRLARDGRTNREIAAELFISTRTVEWHFRKVFAKLGITSRRDLHNAVPP